MAELQTAHTADLDPEVLQAGRALLYDVFDDMTEQDWEHSLGGIHALVWEGPELIGHGSVIQRRLLHGDRAWRAGYVEGVGVRADRRGRGHGTAMMARWSGSSAAPTTWADSARPTRPPPFTPRAAGSRGGAAARP